MDDLKFYKVQNRPDYQAWRGALNSTDEVQVGRVTKKTGQSWEGQWLSERATLTREFTSATAARAWLQGVSDGLTEDV